MHEPNLHLRGYPPVGPLPASSGIAAEPARSWRPARPTPPKPPTPRRRVSLASLTSALTLLGLIGGLGYGAHALLLDLQRVGFATVELPPKRLTETSLIAPPSVERRDSGRRLSVREWESMFLPAASTEPPAAVLASRDGPISAIDPRSSGLFAPSRAAAAESPAAEAAPSVAGAGHHTPDRTADRTPDGPNGGQKITLSPDEAARAEAALTTALDSTPPKILLHATDEVWVRVRDGDAVIFEGILPPGGQYEVPERAEKPLLRAGNAGALYVLVDEAPYGPVGSSTRVLKNMSLRAADVTDRLAGAAGKAVCPGSDGASDGPLLLRAAANLGQ